MESNDKLQGNWLLKKMLIFLEIIAVFVIAYLALAGALYFMQPNFLFQPVREVLYTPDELGLDFEKVSLKTEDGLVLECWYIPAKNSEFTVLFCHGNGGNMMHRLDSINMFYDLGLSCFIFDYRGYGNSEGTPTEEGTYIDALTAYNWMVNKKKISPDKIIIFGRSLGGSIAAQLASRAKAKSLVVESAFTSYVDIGKKFYPYMPIRWFAKFNYGTIDYIKKVNCPILVIHSRNDELVPFEFGLELYESINQPSEFVEISGSHNDGFITSGKAYTNGWKEWIKFLKEYKSQANSQRAF